MKQFTKATKSLLWTLSLAGVVLQASLSSRATLRTLEVPEASQRVQGSKLGVVGGGWFVPLAGRRWATWAARRT